MFRHATPTWVGYRATYPPSVFANARNELSVRQLEELLSKFSSLVNANENIDAQVCNYRVEFRQGSRGGICFVLYLRVKDGRNATMRASDVLGRLDRFLKDWYDVSVSQRQYILEASDEYDE